MSTSQIKKKDVASTLGSHQASLSFTFPLIAAIVISFLKQVKSRVCKEWTVSLLDRGS